MLLLLEGTRIEPLLERVQAEHGPSARIIKAERLRTGGLAGFFAREHFEVTIEVERATAPPAVAPGLEALVAAAEEQERMRQDVALSTRGQVADGAPAGRPLSTEGLRFAAVLDTLRHTADATPTPAAPRPPDESGHRHRLAALGLPGNLLLRLGQDTGPAELLAVLETLPRPPRLLASAGRVVAVVGERRPALDAAARLADRLRLPPGATLVAGRPDPHWVDPATLSSTDQVRRASADARRGDVPVVVAVESGCEPADTDWTEQLLHALNADQVIAVVDATRKAVDTCSWLERLSGPGIQVDAVSVHRAACSADPATVLGLTVAGKTIPVSEVDGAPSSAAGWLGLLLDRLHREAS